MFDFQLPWKETFKKEIFKKNLKKKTTLCMKMKLRKSI